MKKFFAALFALMLTTGAFAQDSTQAMARMAPHKDRSGVMMKDGKVMVWKNGQATALTQDMVLENGTTIMANGSVKMKDGTTSTMQDGDYFRMDGTKNNMKMRMKKPGTLQMKTDSAQ